ncbi:sigma factor regulator N-terminal domain-containing protein [Lysinibacillus sp. NPDC048646]|uniref:sigma factor regulator N-terminal domain-containing protein n=1 Tax=Lysinibacillus sp. NPDC048646 TaxID=3390574 RepID=UPI003CFFAC00
MEKTIIFNEDQAFQNLVKNAKRKSLKRIVFITISVIICFILLLWGLIATGQYFMYKEMDEQTTQNYLVNTFTGANIQGNGSNYDHFFLAGTTKSHMYKDVNGHQVSWLTREHFYTILGTKAAIYTDNTFQNSENTIYRNNQRVIQFYPYTQPKIEDDSAYLKSLPSYYSVEVALSFNKKLTLEEMAPLFPTAQWAWIIENGLLESIDEQEKAEKELAESQKQAGIDVPEMPSTNYGLVNGDNAYGFEIIDSPAYSNNSFQSAEQFIDQIDMYAYDEKEALAILKEKMVERGEDTSGLAFHGHEKLDEAEVLKNTIGDGDVKSLKVSGVVLTGTIEEVLPYLENDIVHYVSAGVILPY